MAMSMVGASRSRTNVFLRFRDTLRTHKRGPRTNTELKEFKVHKNLLAAQSDDEGSTVDARVYSVPPVWVTMVDDMNRDISQIKIKSAPTHITRTHCDSIFFSCIATFRPPLRQQHRLTSAAPLRLPACATRSLRAVDDVGQEAAARLCRR